MGRSRNRQPPIDSTHFSSSPFRLQLSAPTAIQTPVGNIIRLTDAALKTQYNSGTVAPECAYAYDAVYRLIEATGRESIGQTEFASGFDNPRDFPFLGSTLNPNDLQALRRFTESYAYDHAGNIQSLAHAVSGGGWTRAFSYEEASQLEAGKASNRLSSTTVGATTVNSTYDVHGNLLALPHVSSMGWNFKDEFQTAILGGGSVAFYVYDASGQRARKIIETNGTRRKERIYVGGFEVWREYRADGVTVETERETLHVMDDKQRVALVETLVLESGNAVSSPIPRLRYQLGNHLGSSSVELDAAAALISYEEYHPYGTTALQAHNSNAEVSLKRYRYTTKERDDETGLNHHGARYYAPWLVRWTSTDPSGLSDGLNAYKYANNSPVRYFDPDGTTATDRLRIQLMFERPAQQAMRVAVMKHGMDSPQYKSAFSQYMAAQQMYAAEAASEERGRIGFELTLALGVSIVAAPAVVAAAESGAISAGASAAWESTIGPGVQAAGTILRAVPGGIKSIRAAVYAAGPALLRFGSNIVEAVDEGFSGITSGLHPHLAGGPDLGSLNSSLKSGSGRVAHRSVSTTVADLGGAASGGGPILPRGVHLNKDEVSAAARLVAEGLPLTTDHKNAIRAEARQLWADLTGRPAAWDDLEIHHRIPLEWQHLFRNDPNDRQNLMGVKNKTHTLITNEWNAWRNQLGRTPTAQEVLQKAALVDRQFGGAMTPLK